MHQKHDRLINPRASKHMMFYTFIFAESSRVLLIVNSSVRIQTMSLKHQVINLFHESKPYPSITVRNY